MMPLYNEFQSNQNTILIQKKKSEKSDVFIQFLSQESNRYNKFSNNKQTYIINMHMHVINGAIRFS